MIICACNYIPEKQLKEIIRKTGATTVEELQAHVDIGNQCEVCREYIEKYLVK